MPTSVSTSAARPWPTLALMAAVLGTGLSAIFVRWAHAPGAVSGFYRMALASALFAVPFSLETRRRPPRSGRAIGLAVLAGLLFAGDLTFWNTSVLLTSAGNATFLGNTAPLWVGLGALLVFREKLRRQFWAGLLTALIGAGLMLGGDFNAGASVGLGSVLALIAGFFYAGYFLATQRAREGLSAFASWWISALASAAGLLAASFALGQPIGGYSPATYGAFLALALVVQAGGYMLINYALGHLPAPIVSTTLLLQPIVTTIAGLILLNEQPSALDLLGGLLVLAGVWIVNRAH